MKTKLVVQYTVGNSDYSNHCSGIWILIHDGSCEKFLESLRDLMNKAVKLWYDQMLLNHREYTMENLDYCEESSICKTKKGCEVNVSNITIFHREDSNDLF